MSCRCCPALVAMREEANRLWPYRDRASDGCCGDAAHAARKSDHNPDSEGFATAYDLDHDDSDGFDGFYWSERIRLRQDPRVKYVIFFGRFFSSYATADRPAWTWAPYTGPNAHRSHMHVSVLPSHKRTVAPWFFDTPTPQEDDVPAPTDIVRVVPAGVHGVDGRAVYKLRSDGALEFHGGKDYGDYLRLAPHLRQGDRRFVDIIVDASGYTLYANDRSEYRFNVRG